MRHSGSESIEFDEAGKGSMKVKGGERANWKSSGLQNYPNNFEQEISGRKT